MSNANSISQVGPNLSDLTLLYKKPGDKPELRRRPVELTREFLQRFSCDSTVTQVQSCVPRIRHVFGERKEDGGKNCVAYGSGLVIDSNGFILTCAHVADVVNTGQILADFTLLPGQTLPVKLLPDDVDKGINTPSPDREIDLQPVPVEVLVSDPSTDLAILTPKIPEGEDPWRKLEFNTSSTNEDDVIWALGHNTFVRHCQLVSGHVLKPLFSLDGVAEEYPKLRRFVELRKEQMKRSLKRFFYFSTINNSIFSTLPVRKGDSGGPVCDANGKLYGVNSAVIPPLLTKVCTSIARVFGYRVKNQSLTFSARVEERIFPFFKRVGIEPDDVLASKPLNFSNIIYRRYRRALK